MSLQIQLKKSAVSQKQPFASDLAVGELALNYNAAGPFLTCKDTAGNVRKLNNVWVSNSAPTGPSAGDLWLDTSASLAVLKVYKDATATWVDAVSVPIATTSIFGKVQLASAADITNATAGKVVDAAQLQSKITTELSANPITFQGVSVVNDVTISGNLTVNGTQTIINTQTLDVEDKNIVIGNVTTPSDATADGGGISLLGATTKTINWVDATDSWTSSENVDLASGKSYRIDGTEVLSATALGSAVQISSANIPDGTIVDADINASAEIAVSKLADGAARQLLQTDAAGTGVEWTDNVDIPGTLDVTGAATFDSSVAVTGALTKSGNNVVTVGDTETVTSNMIAGPIAVNKGGTGQTTYTDGQLLIGKTDGSLAKAALTAGSNVTITNGDGSIEVASTDTTYTAGDGLDLTGTVFSADLKANGGLTIESTELAVDLGATSITGTLASGDGGTGYSTYTDGQLLIGKTDGTLAKTTLTAGTNITITNGDGAVTINAATIGITAVTGTSPIASSGGATPDISIQDATTTQKGAVQLEDSTSSTSITTAATPNSVKSAYDLADAALPKAGGTLTGDVTLNAQSDLRFADSDSSNWVALQAPATVASNFTWTLPSADGTSNQALITDGTGSLSWGSPASMTLIAEEAITTAVSNIIVTNLPSYTMYKIIFDDVSSSNSALAINLSDDNGSTLSTNYLVSNSTGTKSAVVDLYGLAYTSGNAKQIISSSAGGLIYNVDTSIGLVNAIRFRSVPNANFTAGTIYLYGIS